MSLRKLAGETAVYGISSILARGLNFLLTPLYTAVFAEVSNGVQSSIFGIIAYVAVFATLRLDVAYFRFVGSEDKGKLLSSTMLTILCLSSGLGLLLLLGSPWIASWYGFPEHQWFLALAGGIMIFDAAVEIPLAKLRIESRPWRFAAARLTGTGTLLSLNLLFFWLLPNLPSPPPQWLYRPEIGIGYVFISNLVASGVVLALLLPELRGLEWSIDRALIKRLLGFSLPLVLVGASFIVNELLDRMLLPIMWPGGTAEGQALNGVYTMNYKLAMLLALFTQAFRYGAEPFFFRESVNSTAKANYARVAHYYLIVALLGVLLVTLFLPVFSQLMLSREAYREGYGVVPILLLANLCLGMYYNFSVWYKVTDRTGTGAYISLFGAAVTIVLNVLLIPRYGYWGCAWTTLVCYGSMMLVTYFLGQKHYRVAYPTRVMLTYTTLALVLCGVSLWLAPKQLILTGGTWSEWAELIATNSGLLAVFVAVVAWAERGNLRGRAKPATP